MTDTETHTETHIETHTQTLLWDLTLEHFHDNTKNNLQLFKVKQTVRMHVNVRHSLLHMYSPHQDSGKRVMSGKRTQAGVMMGVG